MKIENKGEELKISYDDFKSQVISDYKIAVTSRECSVLGRREVFSGKGKFGIFGDGKELPQLALNHFFKKGDYRAGYYRDQTLLMAQGLLSISNIFASLYADLDLKREPMSGGRQMGGHFMTANKNQNNEWLNLLKIKNHSGDVSPTGSQMPRLLGLAQASKIYRNLNIKNSKNFSDKGNEIAWGTIGNASTSEGMFFEAINAAGVLQVPMVISIWDDGYGISVSNEEQTTKQNISEALKGFQRTDSEKGFEILSVNGWDYLSLIETYDFASKIARSEHVPVLIHVKELTQPLGHSSSGSHERYKSKSRLEWEKEYDCNLKMREWIISEGLATELELENIEKQIVTEVRNTRRQAWNDYQSPIIKERENLIKFESSLKKITQNDPQIHLIFSHLEKIDEIGYKDLISAGRKINLILAKYEYSGFENYMKWFKELYEFVSNKISSDLYSISVKDLEKIKNIKPTFKKESEIVDGRIIIRDNFDALFKKYDNLIMFGEDVGKIGDVNQGMEGMQKKYGKIRVSDTGIRESTIIGQGIGLAYRGLRPIAEIQYLDYILYCLQILSDDLATMSYRTVGQQFAPLIVRTRGHRLEGIWHSGSQMGGLINLLKGIYILTPRNMTQAAGFYNMLMKIKQPGIVIESLNGYRVKEKIPVNLGEFTVPIGKIETILDGKDITVLSYGSTLRIVENSAKRLLQEGISIEIIDLQCLIPFDIKNEIKESIKKTNRLLIIDEDVPGGASAYILHQLIEKQNIFNLLDSTPKLITAKAHRPAYGSDGDYFSKPSEDDIFEAAYEIMNEYNPTKYPIISSK
ncbi:transketolase [Bacteroidetes bacterium SCGC AAA795-G10]|nr:transketolase [Bacteroidetes bacterium SCGC AAA795-G10]